ncbi:hypothetical protein HMPREF3291_10810 [Bacillus sp. HMSC76G11]|uniref:hypothetical protein n=1 Tax=Metabacillus idriensis TaxID=324768 RepID=UPI0008AA1349|nr:hypothetical protein [Metabacillus idriensis]OHR67393.1 hypothetical protein HMPREF3291_10810 [Bacillus sp. HMSC76G11]
MNKYKVFLGLFICFGLAFVIWSMTEISQSFDEPLEALQHTKHDMEVVIPAYKINDEALFFFIDQKNHLGTAFLKEGIYGWKASSISTNPLTDRPAESELLNYHFYGNSMIYGLLSDEKGSLEVKINGAEARTLQVGGMLEQEIAQKYNLQNTVLWYYQQDELVPGGGEVELLKDKVKLVDEKGF